MTIIRLFVIISSKVIICGIFGYGGRDLSEKNKKLFDEYEFDAFVMAVVPIKYGSKIYSKIMKTNDEFIVPFRPIEVIKRGCEYYASSYEGRKEGTKNLIGVTHKSPIVIEPVQSIYIFPTASPNQQHCYWISHEHVLLYQRIDKKHTEVVFSNKQVIEVPISYRSFENQMLRTALLRTKMEQRSNLSWNTTLFTETRYSEVEALEQRSQYDVFSKQPILSQRSSSKRLNK